WESAENGAWEHKHRQFRFTAEHWLLDIILLDMDGRKATNLTAVERASFYNAGLVFWPNRPKRLGFVALGGGGMRPSPWTATARTRRRSAKGPASSTASTFPRTASASATTRTTGGFTSPTPTAATPGASRTITRSSSCRRGRPTGAGSPTFPASTTTA